MPLADSVLRQRLKTQPWTAYNVRLSREVETLPGHPEFLSTDRRLLGIFRTLSLLYRGDLSGLRVADLGCLEGGFALALAQRGTSVLAIDAREANLDKVRLLREHFDLPSLELAQADVKTLTRETFGTFDVVLCLGLLYHLDDPVEWLHQIAAVTRAVLIVDTHFAPADDAAARELDPSINRVGPLVGYDAGGWVAEGRWFREVPEGEDPHSHLWTAFSNDSSFWLTKASLVTALSRTGFDLVLEQHDWITDQHDTVTTKLARTMVVAARTGAFDPSRASDGALPSRLQGRVTPGPPPPPAPEAPSNAHVASPLRALDRRIQGALADHAPARLLHWYRGLRKGARALLVRPPHPG